MRRWHAAGLLLAAIAATPAIIATPAILAATAILAGCAPRPQPPSCIWIVVDTLRADHLEWYGYGRSTAPELRPLVEGGVLFEHAYTTLPQTTPAISSMLTGLQPFRHGVTRLYVRLNDRNVTAGELLARAGYRTAAFVSSFVMIRDFSNFGRGFETYDDFVSEREAYRDNYERKAGATLAVARAWITRHRRAPFFCMIHLIDPHGPYMPPGAFAERFHSRDADPIPEAVIPSYQKIPGVVDANRYRDRYDGAIAYASHELGGFLDFLRAEHLFDPSLIVFVADHGEEMGEHGHYFEHGDDLFEQNLHVPLIIKPPAGAPARRGGRVADAVSVADLLPTTLALLGRPRPTFLQGRNLAPLLAGVAGSAGDVGREGGVHFELHPGHPLAGEVRAGRKILVADDGRIEMFDLAADPAERHPLPVPPADAVAFDAWRQAAAAWKLGFTPEVNSMAYSLRTAFIRSRGRVPATEDERRLRSLGYL